jgi:hypothetical protein
MDTTSPRSTVDEGGRIVQESSDNRDASLGGSMLTRSRLIQGPAARVNDFETGVREI